MVEPAIFGPIDAVLEPGIEYVVLVLVLVNMATRLAAHRVHVRQAKNGADAIERYVPHEAINGLLVLAAFYYTSLYQHSGIVLSMLIVGMVIADFFEFEARKVEARESRAIDTPKGAIAGSLLVLAYAAFLSLFFIIEPVWNAIV